MEKMFLRYCSLGIAMMLVFASCKKESEPDNGTNQNPVQQTGPTPYKLEVPLGFPQPYYSAKNPLTVEGVALGKRLYDDDILSSNGMKCTSCHQPARSFSSGTYTAPNGYRIAVMAHVNLAFNNIYNWEGSAPDLDTLAMGDFEPPIFNTNPVELVSRLMAHPDYPGMFKKAFGISHIDSLSFYQLKVYISYALAQYLRTKISATTAYDRYRLFKKPLTLQEQNGMIIFFSEKGDCFHCHSDPLFTDNAFHNNGLNDVFTGFDQGRFLVTGKTSDMGLFRAPTLRNIELSAPYMHDARYNTLEEVVDFYSSGVKVSPTLDPIMTKRLANRAVNLTPDEKLSLVAFLKTLTDTTFVNK